MIGRLPKMKIACAGLLAAAGVALPAAELLQNGNFASGQLAPWVSAQRNGGQKALHTVVNAGEGGCFLKITGDPANQCNGGITLVQPLPALDAGKTYLLYCRVRSKVADPKNKSLEIVIRQENAEKSGMADPGIRSVDLGNGAWKRYGLRFRPDKPSAKLELCVLSKGLGAEDEICVDDVSLQEEVEIAKPFNPAGNEVKPGRAMSKAGVEAKIDDATGILRSLSLGGEKLQPEAVGGALIFVQKDLKEYYLDGKGTPVPEVPFTAKAEYQLGDDGIFTEVVTITATADADAPFKVGVRHGFAPLRFSRIVNALSPLCPIKSDDAIVYGYGQDANDLNPSDPDACRRHAALPMAILENRDCFILAGSFRLDDFVTFAPNHPENSFPSLQRNPLSVKKGDVFRFETNYKYFPKSANLLRDVWRFYCDRLTAGKPELAKTIPLCKDGAMIENGIFGGRSADDFEVLRACTSSVVCLERNSLFQLAVQARLDGVKTALDDAGIAENGRYLDYLLAQHPEYRNDRLKLAQLCQLRVCLYDLSMGAVPGGLDEAKPVPETLTRFAREVSSLRGVNQSFAVALPNGSNVSGFFSASAWQNEKRLRAVAFNNSNKRSHLLLFLERAHFASLGWNESDRKNAKAAAVTPEGERPLAIKLDAAEKYLIVEADLEPFEMMALEINR